MRDAVADLDLPLNRMEQRRHRLEELFQADAAPGFETTGAADVQLTSAQGPPVRRTRPAAASSTTSGTGPTTGRAWAGPQIVRALCWHSLRSAFGIGRGVKAKIVVVITSVIICLPAVVNAAMVALNPGQRPAGQL